ncbi:LysE family translocator [Granulosicoccus sp. 3-233]|uniref:LysE family translocator n=1 Tax=Granulosicoccus sp. 3-233 TaxID=3417969 RepID=UPI003D345F76
MVIELWLAFVIASTILLIIPGPTILTVISYSIAQGKRANIPLVAAVALGDSTALILSLAGLGTILATSAWLFTVIKWVGGLYLVYLGVRMLMSNDPPVSEGGQPEALSPWTLFANTWLVTALNPKGIIFFVAFLPQFLDHDKPVPAQLWILSLTFVALASLNAMLYAVFATNARNLLSSSAARKRFNRGGGCLLTIAGGWALTARQAMSS